MAAGLMEMHESGYDAVTISFVLVLLSIFTFALLFSYQALYNLRIIR